MNAFARASLWAGLSGALLFGGWLALCAFVARNLPFEIGRELFRVIAVQALGPLWLATLASVLVLARIAPASERTRAGLALGIAVCAALWFPPVGAWLFDAWSPGGLADWLWTWLVLVTAVGTALWLPRRFVRALAPGVFARSGARGKVAG